MSTGAVLPLICVRSALHRDGDNLVFKDGDTAHAEPLKRCARIDLTGGGTVRESSMPGSPPNEFEVLTLGAKAKFLRVPGVPTNVAPRQRANDSRTQNEDLHRLKTYDSDGAVCGVCFMCVVCRMASGPLSLSARHALLAQRPLAEASTVLLLWHRRGFGGQVAKRVQCVERRRGVELGW